MLYKQYIQHSLRICTKKNFHFYNWAI